MSDPESKPDRLSFPFAQMRGLAAYRRAHAFDLVPSEENGWQIVDSSTREPIGVVRGVQSSQESEPNDEPSDVYKVPLHRLVGSRANKLRKQGMEIEENTVWAAANEGWRQARPVKARTWRFLSFMVHVLDVAVVVFKTLAIGFAIVLAVCSADEIWSAKESLSNTITNVWLVSPN